MTAQKTNEWVLDKAGVKRELSDTVKARKLQARILWSHNEETRELPGERDNASNNARCTKARKTTHGLDGQHQDVVRTLRGRVRMTEDRDKWKKYVRDVANPSDRRRLKNSEQ